jgi:MFS family permease
VLRRRFGDDAMLWGLLGVLATSFLLLSSAGGSWVVLLLGVQAIANGVYSPLTKTLLNQEIDDSSQRAAILSVDSMGRRAAMGIFAPVAGLYGEDSVLELCGAIGVVGLVILLFTRLRRPAMVPSVEAGD